MVNSIISNDCFRHFWSSSWCETLFINLLWQSTSFWNCVSPLSTFLKTEITHICLIILCTIYYLPCKMTIEKWGCEGETIDRLTVGAMIDSFWLPLYIGDVIFKRTDGKNNKYLSFWGWSICTIWLCLIKKNW